LGLVDPGAEVRWEWKLRGPILEIGTESYLLRSTVCGLIALSKLWRDTGERENWPALSLSRRCVRRGADLHIDLEAYRETLIANARELSVDARPEGGSGDLILRPVVSGDFPALSAEEIEHEDVRDHRACK
jgi:hypothetical protein